MMFNYTKNKIWWYNKSSK